MTPLTCVRCNRPAVAAIAAEGITLTLCRRHARQAAAALRRDPRVLVGGRPLVLDPPWAGGAR